MRKGLGACRKLGSPNSLQAQDMVMPPQTRVRRGHTGASLATHSLVTDKRGTRKCFWPPRLPLLPLARWTAGAKKRHACRGCPRQAALWATVLEPHALSGLCAPSGHTQNASGRCYGEQGSQAGEGEPEAAW